MHTHTHTHIDTRTHARTHARTHTHAHMHTLMHTLMCFLLCHWSGCDQHCNNTAGSYFCSCRSGFMVAPSNSSECLPITCDDPPSTLPAASPNATATLTDSEPFEFGDDITYTCSPGYTVDGESVSATTLTLRCRADGDVSGVFEDGCVDVDECSDGVNGGCEVYCTNTAGSYECSCPSGYRLTNGTACAEINECEEDSPCDQTCTNTAGSFVCSCGIGFTLDTTDNTTCSRVSCGAPPFEQLNATVSEDAPTLAVYEDVVVYNCYDGYTTSGEAAGSSFFFSVCQPSGDLAPLAPTACYDVNECDADPCDQLCTNTLGGFACACSPGYNSTSATTCGDIDECEQEDVCAQDANTECVNSPGSFACECLPGFSRFNGTCQPDEYNLLAADVGELVGDSKPQRFATDWLYLDGGGAVDITEPLFVSSTFSVSVQVQLAPGTGGYIFAVTSASGATRHFAIYVYELTQRVRSLSQCALSWSVEGVLSFEGMEESGFCFELPDCLPCFIVVFLVFGLCCSMCFAFGQNCP